MSVPSRVLHYRSEYVKLTSIPQGLRVSKAELYLGGGELASVLFIENCAQVEGTQVCVFPRVSTQPAKISTHTHLNAYTRVPM